MGGQPTSPRIEDRSLARGQDGELSTLGQQIEGRDQVGGDDRLTASDIKEELLRHG